MPTLAWFNNIVLPELNIHGGGSNEVEVRKVLIGATVRLRYLAVHAIRVCNEAITSGTLLDR